MEIVLSLLAWWGLGGLVFGTTLPKPKTPIGAMWQVFVLGPVAWVLFPIVSIFYALGGKRHGKKPRD